MWAENAILTELQFMLCFSYTGGQMPWRKPQFYRISYAGMFPKTEVCCLSSAKNRLWNQKGNIWLCLQDVIRLAEEKKTERSLKGDSITYFIDLQRPLPAVTAGVMLRATRGVGPVTCQCGTLHCCGLYFTQKLITDVLPPHLEDCGFSGQKDDDMNRSY